MSTKGHPPKVVSRHPTTPNVVIGTATGPGIAEACARRLDADGYPLVFLSRSGSAVEVARDRIPMGRTARTAVVADAVAHLHSTASWSITGQTVRVDGGPTHSG